VRSGVAGFFAFIGVALGIVLLCPSTVLSRAVRMTELVEEVSELAMGVRRPVVGLRGPLECEPG
jgi:hypothetical protein